VKPETRQLLLRLLDGARGNAEDNLYRCRLTNVYGMAHDERKRLDEYVRGCEAQLRAAEDAKREVEAIP
jgi:hypothetical protein